MYRARSADPAWALRVAMTTMRLQFFAERKSEARMRIIGRPRDDHGCNLYRFHYMSPTIDIICHRHARAGDARSARETTISLPVPAVKGKK